MPFQAFRRGLSMLLAFSWASSLVVAQDATTTAPVDNDEIYELEEFVVHGIRESLVKSVEIRRGSYSMVDAIVAEDIGKFPDNNVVESLQRVSGVQVTDRTGGEVSTVSIRGLNDVNTTINGRNIFTASGRSVALQDIPASLLGGVNVFKTRAADQIETGIAGVIDIRTHRPFDFEGDKIVLAARGIYQEQNEKMDPNLSGLYSTIWETDAGKFGILFNVSWAKTHFRDQSVTPGAVLPFATGTPPAPWTPYERMFLTRAGVAENPIWEPGLEAGLPYAEGSTLPMTINGVTQNVPYLLSRDAIFQSDLQGERERPAANLSVQFAPNDNATYTFEVFYNGYRQKTYNSLLFSFVDWWGSLNANSPVTLYPGTNVMKERTILFPYSFTSGDQATGKTDSTLYAIGGDWKIGSDLKLKSELTYQDSSYKTEFFAMRFDRVFPSVTVDFNDDGDGVPAFSFGDDASTPNVNEGSTVDPSLWTIAQLYDNGTKAEGDAWTYTIDGDYDVDWSILDLVSFGARYDLRTASEFDRPAAVVPFLGQNLSNHPEWGATNKGFFDGRADVPTSWLSGNGPYLMENRQEILDTYRTALNDPTIYTNPLSKNFEVEEGTTSAYLMSTFSTKVLGRTFDGQFGVRYVNVQTDMTFIDDAGAISTDDASTDKFLPSIDLRYSITPDVRFRVSYGETLRRPAFGQLNPNLNLVDDVTNIGYGTATGGNPDLEPTKSKNYDISLEYFFGEGSMIYGTWFKREIEGLVVDFRRRIIAQNAAGQDYPYILTQPDNASDGVLDGFEFGFVYVPENLPDVLQGIGVQASLTLLDSEQNIPITNDVGTVVGETTTPFFGVSDTSYSVAVSYEKGKFSGRLAYVWREDFMANYEAPLFANPRRVFRTPDSSLDAQISYQVTDALMITIDGTNLLQPTQHSYYENEDIYNFGNWIVSRTIAIGARYSF